MSFKDRKAAGQRLATALAGYADERPVILALPRGGVPVAAEVARALSAPLDVLIVRKVGAPMQPELAMGAIIDGAEPIVVRNEDVISALRIEEAAFRSACERELTEIDRRRRRYLGGRAPVEVAGRTAIIVDDGIATGATIRAALQATRQRKPRRLVLAVPVAPTDTLETLAAEADEIVCLEQHRFFGAIGAYYDDFSQTTDEEVVALLAAASQQPEG